MLNETDLSYKKIAARCGVSKSVARKIGHMKLRSTLLAKKFYGRVGRPRCLDERDERSLMRVFKTLRNTTVDFSVEDVMQESGFDASIAKQRTIPLYLNRADYQHLQARKGY